MHSVRNNPRQMDNEISDEGANTNEFQRNGGSFGGRFYGRGGPQGQMDFQQNNNNYHFHPHQTPYRSRGHPRGAPWIRSRFTSPNQINGEFSPRMFYGNRGNGHSRGPPHDGTHQPVKPYGGYRAARRHRHCNPHTYQPASPNYYSYHNMTQVQDEYAPYSYNNNNSPVFPPRNDPYRQHNECMVSLPALSPASNGFYTPAPSMYSPKHRDTPSVNPTATDSDVPYCPENFQMDIPEASPAGTNTCDVDQLVNLNYDTCNRSPSPISSDENSSSVFLTSDSSSDGLDNDDSGVSTFEPSEGEEKNELEKTSVDVTNIGEEVIPKSIDVISDTEAVIQTQDDAENEFMAVYIQVKSLHVIDSKGSTSSDELSCYGLWFGDNDDRNLVEEVSTKYTQDRFKSGYIVGVVKALELIKSEGFTNKVHFVMGSPFIMNNLSSWVKNLKCENACSTNWTEWKHFNEINLLLAVIDGMIMKFSLAHPRDKFYILCKGMVASYWNEIKNRRLLQSPPLSPYSTE